MGDNMTKRKPRPKAEVLFRNEDGNKKCLHCGEWKDEGEFNKGTACDKLNS